MTTRFSWSKAFRKVRSGQKSGDLAVGLITDARGHHISPSSSVQVLRKQLNHSDSDPHIDCLTSKKREGGGGGTTPAPTVNGSDDGAAPSPPPSFAAAWVARELARQGADLEDVIAAACSEGGSGADAGALRAAAQRARDQAGGDPAAALTILAACCRAHEEQEVVKAVVPHDGWLLGAPKPACHAQRVQTADKINQMRATRDGEIGETPLAAGWSGGEGEGRCSWFESLLLAVTGIASCCPQGACRGLGGQWHFRQQLRRSAFR